MKKHVHLYVNIKDYQLYQEKYRHDRLDKWYRIQPPPSKGKMFAMCSDRIYEEEIFDGTKSEYTIDINGNNYLILFKTNSGSEYRFDIFNEPNTKIYHLAFSDSNSDISNISSYENPTNRNESKEIFSRLSWILKDISKKIDVDEFCIGFTNDTKKDNIYQYMMRFVSEWEKRETNDYPIGWALYFKLS